MEEYEAHEEGGERQEQAAREAEVEDERGGYDGSEGEAGVAADGEEAHAAGASAPET